MISYHRDYIGGKKFTSYSLVIVCRDDEEFSSNDVTWEEVVQEVEDHKSKRLGEKQPVLAHEEEVVEYANKKIIQVIESVFIARQPLVLLVKKVPVIINPQHIIYISPYVRHVYENTP